MKLFWIYICDRCDHAGVWEINWRLAKFHLGEFAQAEVEKALIGRYQIIADGRRWFLRGFIKFQYPTGLSTASPAHKRIRSTLLSHGLNPDTLVYTLSNRVCNTPEDKDEDKDREEDKDSLSDATHIGSPADPAPGPISDADHWRMQIQFEAWVNALKDANCKIGVGSWRAWKALVDRYGIPGVVSASKGVPATERFSDKVEATLDASRGQGNPGDMIAHRIVRMTL